MDVSKAKSGLNTSDRAGSMRAGSMKGDAGTSGNFSGGPGKDDPSYFAFLGHTSLAYKFKGSEQVEKGQYRVPFIAKLPQRLPGTFIHRPKREADIREGKNLEVLSI